MHRFFKRPALAWIFLYLYTRLYISIVLPSFQIKISGKSVHGFMSYGQTFKSVKVFKSYNWTYNKTEITTLYNHRYFSLGTQRCPGYL